MIDRFLKERRGTVVAMWALAALPIMAAVAGLIDYVSASKKAAELQSVLDATALGVAAEQASTPSAAELLTKGELIFNAHLSPEEAGGYLDLGVLRKIGEDKIVMIEARASFKHEGFLGWDIWRGERRSVAAVRPRQPACMLALHPTAGEAIRIGGSASVELDDCILAANSNARNAISRGGAAQLSAQCTTSVGGTEGLQRNTRLDCDSPRSNQPATPDPLADVSPPAYTACKRAPEETIKILSPGTYCNQTLAGAITLLPGTYVLRGGEIDLQGNGSIVGEGVTIFLTEGARFRLTGNQVATLSPPQTGPYAGILLFQARDNANELRLGGGAGTALSGFVYAPAAVVSYYGTSGSATDECLRIIASEIALTGNSSIRTDCGNRLGGISVLTEGAPVLVR